MIPMFEIFGLFKKKDIDKPIQDEHFGTLYKNHRNPKIYFGELPEHINDYSDSFSGTMAVHSDHLHRTKEINDNLKDIDIHNVGSEVGKKAYNDTYKSHYSDDHPNTVRHNYYDTVGNVSVDMVHHDPDAKHTHIYYNNNIDKDHPGYLARVKDGKLHKITKRIDRTRKEMKENNVNDDELETIDNEMIKKLKYA